MISSRKNYLPYKLKLISAIIFLIIAVISCEEGFTSNEDSLYKWLRSGEEKSGGETTTYSVGERAFSKNAANLSFEERTQFLVGNSFFDTRWVQSPASTTAIDGLGPLFNSNSCNSCHLRDGRGAPPTSGQTVSLLFRLSVSGTDATGAPLPDPIYGGQLQTRGINGVDAEGQVTITHEYLEGSFADGEPYQLEKPTYSLTDLAYGALAAGVQISPRVAPQMIGMGLLEAVAESDILALQDINDANNDGISGKANFVHDVESGVKKLGRFGWKANQPSVKQQVAGAFQGDLGLSTSLFPAQNHTTAQNLSHLATGEDTAAVISERYEVRDNRLNDVVFYSMHLAVPARRNWDTRNVLEGKKLFFESGCESCHTSSFVTGDLSGFDRISSQQIYPYTDLLLHDMGDGLADKRPDFDATGKEWRTPPLWGIGLFQDVNKHTRYLHDGRARNLSEAILWHGGEAAASKNAYINLTQNERNALIAFLESL